MFVILRGAHARFERGGRPASADDTCCPSASAEILRGSCALFGRPSHVPRDCPTPQVQASSPGGGTCAGSLVESGSVGASPGALRAHSSAHFFAALLVAKPEPFVRIEARILRCAAKSARCGVRFCGRCRTHCPDVLPGRRLCLRGVRLRSTAGGKVGALRRSLLRQMRGRAHRRAFACERREAAFPAMFRRRHGVAVLPRNAPRIFLRFRQDGGNVMRRGKRCLLPGRENGRSAEDQVSRTPDNQAEVSAFVRISPCAWRRAPVPWWR